MPDERGVSRHEQRLGDERSERREGERRDPPVEGGVPPGRSSHAATLPGSPDTGRSIGSTS
jgi:hypothetical protein